MKRLVMEKSGQNFKNTNEVISGLWNSSSRDSNVKGLPVARNTGKKCKLRHRLTKDNSS